MSASGAYRVELTGPALRDLGTLPRKVVDAVINFLDGPLADNPIRVTKPLQGRFAGVRSGYVGISYRVLVEVDDAARIVYVIGIAHRADAYRRP